MQMPYWPSYRKSKNYFLTSENKILILSNNIKIKTFPLFQFPARHHFEFLTSFRVSRSAIGQFFFLSIVTVPEVFAKVKLAQFLLASKVTNSL